MQTKEALWSLGPPSHPKKPYLIDSSVHSATGLVIRLRSRQTTRLRKGMDFLRLLCWLLISEGATSEVLLSTVKKGHVPHSPVLGLDCSESYSVNLRKTQGFCFCFFFKNQTHFIVLKSSDLLHHQLQGNKSRGWDEGWPRPTVVPRRQALWSGFPPSVGSSVVDVAFHSHTAWTLQSSLTKLFTASWVRSEWHFSFNM